MVLYNWVHITFLHLYLHCTLHDMLITEASPLIFKRRQIALIIGNCCNLSLLNIYSENKSVVLPKLKINIIKIISRCDTTEGWSVFSCGDGVCGDGLMAWSKASDSVRNWKHSYFSVHWSKTVEIWDKLKADYIVVRVMYWLCYEQ